MGSTGSGNFGSYHGNGENSNSGDPGEIKCPTVIENIRLEDVATSEYYTINHSLPSSGEAICLRDKIHNGRLVVEKIDTHEILGNLPIQYNYLVNCIQKGMQYKGSIITTGEKPIPFIVVNMNA